MLALIHGVKSCASSFHTVRASIRLSFPSGETEELIIWRTPPQPTYSADCSLGHQLPLLLSPACASYDRTQRASDQAVGRGRGSTCAKEGHRCCPRCRPRVSRHAPLRRRHRYSKYLAVSRPKLSQAPGMSTSGQSLQRSCDHTSSSQSSECTPSPRPDALLHHRLAAHRSQI